MSSPSKAQDKDLCILAKRVPKAAKGETDDQTQDNLKVRSCLVGLIQHLHLHPELTEPTFLALIDGKIKAHVTDDKASFPRQYTYIAKIPKFVKAQILTMAGANKEKLNQAICNKIDNKDSLAIEIMFNNALQTHDSSYLDQDLREKDTFTKSFMLRMKDCGDRVKAWLQKGLIADDGTVDTSKLTAYTFTWNETSHLTMVSHTGDEADMSKLGGIVVTKAFEVLNPLDDMKASLKLGASTVSLPDLFDAGKGPKTHDYDPAKLGKGVSFLTKYVVKLKEMAQRDHPKVEALIDDYLSQSEKHTTDARKTAAQARMKERYEGQATKKLAYKRIKLE